MGTVKDRKSKDNKDNKRRRNQEETEKIHRKTVQKKVLMTCVTMMVWSLMQSQTFWSMKSSGPQEALLQKKLVEVMEFQLSYFKS